MARVGRCLVELGPDVQSSPAVAVALDDAIAERVACGASPPTLRIWENDRALVLPRWRLRDRAAAEIVDRRGRAWPVCARGSGGAAIAHGPGVLNVSLILPRDRRARSIDDDYRLWIAILDNALRPAYGIAVDAAEVDGAVCSGKFDAVAGGRKLAGTAQARRGGSVVVHGTVFLRIDRVEYCRLVEAAERLLGMRGREALDPDRVVSLDELAERRASAGELADAIVRAIGVSRRDKATPSELLRARQIAADSRAPTAMVA